jgi:DNA-binding IclR family transcriptional regulator
MPAKEIKSLQKCFSILSAFTKDNPQLDAGEILRIVGVPKSSIYRYLSALVGEQMLEYDPTAKKYMLSSKILELASIVYDQLELRKIALPFIKQLAEKTKETVYLTALNKNRAICIERVESNFALRLSVNRGESFPLHASATSTVLMAYLSNEEQERIIAKGLKKFTNHTIIDPIELKAKLNEIKSQGFAYSDQELDEGARAVSAPIFNCLGKIVAGLSIAGPIQRFSDEKIEEFKTLVTENAKSISARLGYVRGKGS